MAVTQYWRAINRALDEELARDERVLLFGEDVALPGGVFGVTRELAKKHGPSRVWDAPIAENGFVGAAVGAAMTGMRPVCELMFMDFSLVAADQLVNHAAKIRFMTQGAYQAPMVIRAQQGVSPASSAQHSQSLEALFTGIPGLTVVAPSNPADAYGLLKSAIRCDDPVLFIEHRMLYPMSGELADTEFLEPLGSAKVTREGDDLTLISWLQGVVWAEQIADRLAEHGTRAEVIDLRSLQPVDYATLEASATKTGNVAIVHEAIRTGGLGAEIAATLAEDLGDALHGPVRRFGAAFIPSPVAPSLITSVVPQVDEVAAALAATVAGSPS
jgi:pyruvate/2-oxoglutarate/acetoin dehydrogenase E1 component